MGSSFIIEGVSARNPIVVRGTVNAIRIVSDAQSIAYALSVVINSALAFYVCTIENHYCLISYT
jgi:hypothetical protein